MSQIIEKENSIRNSNLPNERKKEEFNKLYQGNAHRAFMGKDNNGDVSVKLMGSKGRQRIRMVIDKNDVPRIEFLNEDGEVTYKLPPEKDE